MRFYENIYIDLISIIIIYLVYHCRKNKCNLIIHVCKYIGIYEMKHGTEMINHPKIKIQHDLPFNSTIFFVFQRYRFHWMENFQKWVKKKKKKS